MHRCSARVSWNAGTVDIERHATHVFLMVWVNFCMLCVGSQLWLIRMYLVAQLSPNERYKCISCAA